MKMTTEPVALLGDVGLAALEHVKGQGDVEGVGESQRQKEDRQVGNPIPNKVAKAEYQKHKDCVEWKEIGGEADQKIVF